MPQIDSAYDLALHIVRRLHGAGHVAYFAGGCVRDRIMQRMPKDYDIATSARPEQVLQLFPRSQKVGAAFGVVLVKHHRLQAEVATFRSDGVYSDGRHPDSVRFTTPEEDARRRDFTCNGIFFDPLNETLHDFVGGQRDIHDKILRAIGDPRARFAEDHLRMLRAIRFAARLDFSLEPQTRAAIEELEARIATISRERIGEEIRMILGHPTRAAALDLFAAFPGLFLEAFGFPASPHQAGWPVVAGLPQEVSRPVALAALLLDTQCADLPKAAAELRGRLMLSNDELDQLVFIGEKLPLLDAWENLTKAAFKRLLADPRFHGVDTVYRADPKNADQLFAYAERAASLVEEGVAPPPFITGGTLIDMGLAPGPHFRPWLDALYDRQLGGEFVSQEEAIRAARALIASAPPRP